MIERSFECKGITLHGLLQEGQGTPIIALHGWLDNAGSFDSLCCSLKHRTILALDLAGHGRSDHRHVTSDYSIWKDVSEVSQVISQLGWSKVILLGHSRGAAITTLTAAVLGETVEAIIWIDGGFPMLEQDDFVTQLKKSVDHQLRERRPKRAFRSRDQAITARLRSHFKLTRDQVEQLMVRGLVQHEEGYSWSSDPRLMDASPVRLNNMQMNDALRAISAPILLLFAEDESETMTQWRNKLRALDGIESKGYVGEHHLHMDIKTAAVLAADIEDWLNRSTL